MEPSPLTPLTLASLGPISDQNGNRPKGEGNRTKKNIIWPVLLTVAITTLLRGFLEFFSNPEQGGIFSPWYVLLTYFLFFLAVTIGIGIVIGLFTKESLLKTVYIAAKGTPVILLAPIFDLIISHGTGYCMAYIAPAHLSYLYHFLVYFGRYGHCGITPGIRLELLVVFAFVGFYVWKKTKSVGKTIGVVVSAYAVAFVNLTLIGIIGTFTQSAYDAGPWVMHAVATSMAMTTHVFPVYAKGQQLANWGFATLMSRIHLLTILAMSLFIWAYEKKESLKTWLRNARWERITYYSLLMMLGMVAAYRIYHPSISWIDVLGFIVAVIAVVTNFWTAVVVNDVADITTDSISNPDRPAHQKGFDLSDYTSMGSVFFLICIVSSLTLNYPFLLFMLGFQALYAVYSLRQTRWKKNFVGSSFVIGAVGLFTILAGYFIVSPNQSISILPFGLLIAVFVGLAIMSNAKDLKDRKGDAADGVKTLPVLMGTRNAGLLISVTTILWWMIMGLVFHKAYLLVVAVLFLLVLLVGMKRRISDTERFLILFVAILGLFFFI